MGKKLLLSLVTLVLSLAGAEGGFRVWLRVRGEAFDQAAHRHGLRVLREAALGRYSGEGGEGSDPAGGTEERARWIRAIHPYFAFDRPNGARQLEEDLAHAAAAGPERYAIMILGGSVAAGFSNMGAKTLKAVLGRDPRFEGRKLEVLGYGVAAFKQPQQLLQLAYCFSVGLDIDAVINLDGFNEVVVAYGNAARGINPAFPYYAEWTRMATDWTADPECVLLAARMHSLKQLIVVTADAALASPLRWSAIFAHQQSARLNRLHLEAAECQASFLDRTRGLVPQQHPAVTGPAFDHRGDAPIHLAVRIWKESSISIQSLCAERGVEYLHVLQPTLLDEGSKVVTPEEAASARTGPHWVRGVEVGYPLMRQAGPELEQRGVRFFDAGDIFRDVEERIYNDACHFEQRGNEILAEAIGRAFLDGM